MEQNILQNKWILIGSIILNVILAILLFKPSHLETIIETEYIPVHDTITVTLEKIIPKTKVMYENIVDTCYVNNTDTVYVSIPIEYKEYSDTIGTDSTNTEIKVNYHGAFADIDNIYLKHNYFNEKQTITKSKNSGFGWSVTAGPYIGYGGCINKSAQELGVEMGIGVQVGIGYVKIIK